jgi:hypothetical protein
MYPLSGCLLLFLLLAHPGQVFAVASAFISPEGNGVYVVELQNCVRLREVQLTVDYPLGLGTPQVIPGSSAISNTVNVSSGPSMVLLDVIAQKGSLPSGGYLVSLSFPVSQQGNPVPLGLSGWATDINGSRQPLDTWYQGPNDPPRDPKPDNTDEEQTNDGGPAIAVAPQAATPATVIPPGSGKTVSLPADDLPKPVKAQAPVMERALPRGKGTSREPLPPVQSFQSVLDRFRSFKGDRTEEATLRHLFDPDPGAPFRQTPAVAIADGRSPVIVTFNLASPEEEVNVMVLTNTRMISFHYLNDGTMAEMTVLPEAGKYISSLMIKAGERIYDVPLTVVPPLNPALAALGVSDGKLVRHDYNGDGVVDYIDDYILMANRLALFQIESQLHERSILKPINTNLP